MPKLVLEEVKEFGVLPDETLVLVEVETISERDVPGKDGREGWAKLSFKFVIRDLPGNLKNDEAYEELLGSPIYGDVGMKFTMHPDNKLRQWTEALLNMGELDAGFELDTDILLHRQAKGVIGHYVRKDGGKRNQIDGLLPAGPLGGEHNIPEFLRGDPQPEPIAPTPVVPVVPVQTAAHIATPVLVSTFAGADEDPPF